MPSSAPDHFDAIAGKYAASEVHSSSPTIRRLHELLASKPLGSICDVACGPGHLALSFASKASRIVGVDAAPNMLLQFGKLAKERGMTVETIRGDAGDIPLPSGAFDVVVSRLAPHHFPDPAKAVKEMARLTKPGGRVAVIDLEGNENAALDELNHQLETWHDPSHVRSYTPAQWRTFFNAAGLEIDTLEAGQTELPGGLAVRRWCEIGSTTHDAELKIRQQLGSAGSEQLSALAIRFENGEYYIPVRTLIILGRKN